MIDKCLLPVLVLSASLFTGCASSPKPVHTPTEPTISCTHAVDRKQSFTFLESVGVTRWDDPVYGGTIFIFTNTSGQPLSKSDKEMQYFTCEKSSATALDE